MKPKYIHTEIIHNFNAPSVIVPIILSIGKYESVIDIGCGIGTWLKVFEQYGVKNYLGIDGDYVNKDMIKIPLENFIELDISKPFDLSRKFDLAVCLEVAEHLRDEDANALVESIIAHSENIIFSAAIPNQGGQNHLNEQWPEYWERKFNKYGYTFYDIIRPRIWNEKNVEWWYKQNIFYVTKADMGTSTALSLVHPENYKLKIENYSRYISKLNSGQFGIMFSLRLLVKSLLYKFVKSRMN